MVNIFFDLDGTLINSQQRLYNLFVELCPECKMTYEEYWEIKRQRINQKDFLKKYFNYPDEKCAEIHRLWLEKVEEPERLKQDYLVDGVVEILEKLYNTPLPPSGTSPAGGTDIPPTPTYAGTSPARGADMSFLEKWHEMPKGVKYNLYIVTNRQSKELTIKEIETLGIKKYFKDILVTEQKKTKEELIRENIEISKDDILIGDTGEDIKCAKALGVKSVAVSWGILNENVLKEYQPNYLVYSIKDVTVYSGEKNG